jgi:Mg2+/citrate symporter
MIRPVLTELVLFIAPFVAYAIFLVATRAGVLDLQSWQPRILFWLTGIALVLMIGSFVVIAHFSGEDVGSTYVPARVEDGRFIPGQFK